MVPGTLTISVYTHGRRIFGHRQVLAAHMMLHMMAAKQASSLRPAVAARLTVWCGKVPAQVPMASVVAISAVLWTACPLQWQFSLLE